MQPGTDQGSSPRRESPVSASYPHRDIPHIRQSGRAFVINRWPVLGASTSVSHLISWSVAPGKVGNCHRNFAGAFSGAGGGAGIAACLSDSLSVRWSLYWDAAAAEKLQARKEALLMLGTHFRQQIL